MKLKLYILILGVLLCFPLLSQETTDKPIETETVKEDRPVKTPWNSGILMGGRTSVVPGKGLLRFDLTHNFGSLNNGLDDLLGIYANGANIRMGLNYVPIRNLQLGVGLTKHNITSDFNATWTILEQTREYSIPVSVTLFGNVAIDGRGKEAFGIEYEFVDRLSYYSQLLIGHKVCKYFSVETGLSFSHINNLPEPVNHDVWGVNFGAKIRLKSTLSIILNTDIPIQAENNNEYIDPKYSTTTFQGGVEIITTSHAFQIYIGNNPYILSQNTMIRNDNNFDKDGIRIGFILTKL
ncbi:MAG: DUF5777 family beta-barrel protein [Bacteroidota bacterium]